MYILVFKNRNLKKKFKIKSIFRKAKFKMLVMYFRIKKKINNLWFDIMR